MYSTVDSSDNANESYSTNNNDSSDCDTDTVSESSETTQLNNDSAGNEHVGDQHSEHSELRSLYRRIQTKFNLSSSTARTARDRDTSGDRADSAANSNLILTSNLSVKTLKYLHKLLALYKLDIYLNDLCEAGFYTTISLHQLTPSDLESLHVSPYDKKKFLKLQLFIRQVMSTIKHSQAPKGTVGEPAAAKSAATATGTGTGTSRTISSARSERSSAATARAPSTQSGGPKAKTNKNLNTSMSNSCQNFTSSSATVLASNRARAKPQASSGKQLLKSRTRSIESLRKTAESSKASAAHRTAAASSGSRAGPVAEAAAPPGPAVNHPSSASKPLRQSNSGTHLFGPQCSNSGHVQTVEANTYNYGVFKEAKSTASHRFIGKRAGQAKSATAQQASSKIAAAEIYVFARKRPKLACESQFSDVLDVDMAVGGICVQESRLALDGSPMLRRNAFSFDRTFDGALTNEQLFESSMRPFLEHSLASRQHLSCICFGQTGSGKTHTLFGTRTQDGLCALTAHTLFEASERLLCGFYEIYNGQLYDLLNGANRLVLRDDSQGQCHVVGLVQVEVKSLAQLRKTIDTAQANRHIGITSFNKASSRSHAVVQFTVPAPATQPPPKKQQAVGKAVRSKVNSGLRAEPVQKPMRVTFIDLAGSERGIDAQNNRNDNRKEGAEINQSLLALKECIRCMDQSCTHAPFRQSKLTRVLRDSFVGSGKTALIATVSPTDDCVSCSINTLQYANRVRHMARRCRPSQTDPILEQLRTNCPAPDPDELEQSFENEQRQPQTEYQYQYSKQQQQQQQQNNHAQSGPDVVGAKPRKTTLVKPNSSGTLSHRQPQQHQQQQQQPVVSYRQQKAGEKEEAIAAQGTGQAQPTPLFHPSKINMSSTPIKKTQQAQKPAKTLVQADPSQASTPIKESIAPASASALNVNARSKVERAEFLFEHDTPIKGHKLKHMPARRGQDNSSGKSRTGATTTAVRVPDHRLIIQVNRAESRTSKAKKNEDVESGVETDEQQNPARGNVSGQRLAKGQVQQSQMQQSQMQQMLFGCSAADLANAPADAGVMPEHVQSLIHFHSQSVTSPSHSRKPAQQAATAAAGLAAKDDSHVNKSNGYDESLLALRQRQKQLLQSKHRRLLQNISGSSDSPASANTSLNEPNSDTSTLIPKSRPNHHQVHTHAGNVSVHSSNSKKQLQSYVQSLESKLKSLRVEMDSSFKMAAQHVGSVERADKTANNNNNNNNKGAANTSLVSNSSSSSGSSCDSLREIGTSNVALVQQFLQRRSYLEKRKRRMEAGKDKSAKDSTELGYMHQQQQQQQHQHFNESQVLSSDYEETAEAASKANSDHLLSQSFHKGKGHFMELLDRQAKTRCNGMDQRERDMDYAFQPIAATHSFHPMSASAAAKHKDTAKATPSQPAKATSAGGHPLLTPKALRGSPDSQPTEPGSPTANSSSESPMAPSSVKMNKGQIWNEPEGLARVHVTNQHSPSTSVESESESAAAPASPSKHQNKHLLVEAHEHQLSDITETCKREMNLLSSLKGSQMGYDEYLNQLESMLSKKAHSIRDLQFQISQLKTYHYEGRPIPFQN